MYIRFLIRLCLIVSNFVIKIYFYNHCYYYYYYNLQCFTDCCQITLTLLSNYVITFKPWCLFFYNSLTPALNFFFITNPLQNILFKNLKRLWDLALQGIFCLTITSNRSQRENTSKNNKNSRYWEKGFVTELFCSLFFYSL